MKLRYDVHALYAFILVGLCPCHGYNRMPGKAGGFYHLVCCHGVSLCLCLVFRYNRTVRMKHVGILHVCNRYIKGRRLYIVHYITILLN